MITDEEIVRRLADQLRGRDFPLTRSPVDPTVYRVQSEDLVRVLVPTVRDIVDEENDTETERKAS